MRHVHLMPILLILSHKRPQSVFQTNKYTIPPFVVPSRYADFSKNFFLKILALE